MSRKALASRLRVRAGVVGAWERGEHVPPGDKVIELMLVLEVTPAELLSAGGKRQPVFGPGRSGDILKGEGR